MTRPRLLDLYCCQGGAARGYAEAGFDVIGVDIEPQPRYPYEFHQGNALHFLLTHWSALSARSGFNYTGYLLAATREALQAFPMPWVIENVPGADMRVDVRLCGAMFGLRTYRHRWFELSDPMCPPVLPHPAHRVLTDNHKRRAGWDAGLNTSVTGDVTVDIASTALGIDWMDAAGLSQAIPPAYTRVIGAHLLEQLTTV